MKIPIVVISFLFTVKVVAQEDAHKDSLEYKGKKAVEYSNYFKQIRINNNLAFKQEMNTRTESNFTTFEFPLLFKYNVFKKVNLLGGPKIDLYTDKKGMVDSPLIYSTIGIEYEVDNNFLIEAKFNYRLTDKVPFNTDYTFGSKTSLTVGSKFRF